MAENTLVSDWEQSGRELLEFLDANNFPVVAAFWNYYPDLESWRLVISTVEGDNGSHDAYMKLSRLLSSDGAPNLSFDQSYIKILSSKDKFIKTLSSVIKVQGISSMRFTHNMINGVFLDDALIYRMAA